MSKVIFVVDDEAEILEYLGYVLEDVDCEKKFFTDPEKVVEEVKSSKDLCLIISDYSMPGLNGSELFQKVTELVQVPFLFLSGGYIEDYPALKEIYDNHNDRVFFIGKPFNEEEVLKTVNSVLEKI